jgi:hypothetical protein
MIFLSEDMFKSLKRMYIKKCIIMFIGITCVYAIGKEVEEHKKQINNLTKKIEELKSKGD